MKKLVAFSLALVLILAFSVSAFATTMTDVVTHPDRAAIEEWVKAGYIQGYEDGTFRPNGSITRAEFCTIIMRAFDYETPATLTFSDVPEGVWYYEAVALGVGAGYINGYEDGTFRPSGTITREEAASILCKMLGVQPSDTHSYTLADADELTWSRGYVGACIQQGVMTRYPGDNTFRPKQELTRAEAVVSLRATRSKVVSDANRNAWGYIIGSESTAVSFEMTVQNSLGAPVSGATVILNGGPLGTTIVSRTTGNDGVATFNNTSLGNYDYEIQMDDFTPSTGSVSVTASSKERTVTLAATRTYTLTFTVTDKDSSSTNLSDVTVSLIDLNTKMEEKTGNDGVAKFVELPRGVYSYEVDNIGNEETGTVNVDGTKSQAVSISNKPPTYELKVYVEDQDEKNLTGVTVTIDGEEKTLNSSYVSFYLEAGSYDVEAMKDGYEPGSRSSVRVSKGGDNTTTITLKEITTP